MKKKKSILGPLTAVFSVQQGLFNLAARGQDTLESPAECCPCHGCSISGDARNNAVCWAE